jgi:hypothetical protein
MKLMSFVFVVVLSVLTGSCSDNSSLLTDCWRDGELLQYSTASVGSGVNVVIVGDGFSVYALQHGGVWETTARGLAASFFKVEVIKDFKEYFNVKILMSVSAESGMNGRGKFGGKGGARSSLNEGALKNAVRDIVGNDKIEQTAVIYVANGAMGGWASGGGGGYGFACYSLKQEGDQMYWMRHEFVGHVFAALADEYVAGSNQRHPLYESDHEHGYDWAYTNGAGLNIAGWPLHSASDTSDPYITNKLPPWKDFLGNAEYESESLGAYEGGGGASLGRWRSTPQSYMNTSRNGGFNVISRYAIWMRIGIRAGLHDLDWYQNPSPGLLGTSDHVLAWRFPTAQSLALFLDYDKINL